VIRPFLKWAGGKRQLLPALRLHYPASFDRYIEPFLGSGAVFFDLHAAGRLAGRQVALFDLNPDLIGCYRALRDHTEEVIAALAKLAAQHEAKGVDFYYDVRDRRFNPARKLDGPYTPRLAAMFIYLNRTGFNGLFRLNRDGAFNVPAGRYDNPRICDADHLRAVAAALRAREVSIERTPFDAALALAAAGDFVYCDPPYAPLNATSTFAHYTAGGFTLADHARLHQAVVDAAARGAVIVMSNSSAPQITAAYTGYAARRAGLRVATVPARRAINSRAASRGPVDELIISNSKLKMAKAALRPGYPDELAAAGTGKR
jgi:DNA adenine methylase